MRVPGLLSVAAPLLLAGFLPLSPDDRTVDIILSGVTFATG